MSIADRLTGIRERIAAAARSAGRDPSSIRLVAVSKTFPLEAVREAWTMGQDRPLIIAGLAYFARVPTDGDYLVDVLPGSLLFGAGLTLLVAPLTTAVMASVPTRRAGLASAINNAVSRVGAPLISALIFIAIVGALGLNILVGYTGQISIGHGAFMSQDQVVAAREASTDAFHLAMLVSALLLFTGAAVAAVGLRERPSEGTGEAAREGPGKAEAAAGPAG